jgi:hypothetical protein
MEHHIKRLWVIPLPYFPIERYEFTARLSMEASLLDAQGRTVWTRHYDSGSVIWEPRSGTWFADERSRISHEFAWQLAHRAARDLREWLVERGRPRQL